MPPAARFSDKAPDLCKMTDAGFGSRIPFHSSFMVLYDHTNHRAYQGRANGGEVSK